MLYMPNNHIRVGDLHMENNKEKILGAALLLSLRKGFSNVSIKEIQELSGFAAGSIYYHFKDKDEILEQMVKTFIIGNSDEYKRVVRNFEGSFPEKIEFVLKYISRSFDFEKIYSQYSLDNNNFTCNDYYEMVSSIYHQHPEIKYLYHGLHDGLYELYYELVQEAIEKKEIRDDLDIREMTIFVQTIAKGYLDLLVFQPSFSPEELMSANLKLLCETFKI